MVPLLERGREALRLKYAHLPRGDARRPIGLTVDVVTEEDFLANASLTLRYICTNLTQVRIICSYGDLCVRIEHLPGKR